MTEICHRGAAPQQEEVRALRAPQTGQACHQQRAHGRERQGVGEVTVVLNREERIRFAADENIGVGDKGSQSSHPCRCPAQFLFESRIAEAGAEQRVSEWIHAVRGK